MEGLNIMKKRGFTLIELLVVISIIAVLMSIMLPALSSARERAKRIVCGNQIKNMGNAVNVYAGEYDGKLPLLGNDNVPNFGSDKAEKYPWRGYLAYTLYNDIDYPCGLGYLYEAKAIDNPEVFYCPSSVDWKFEQYDGVDGKSWPSYPNRSDPIVRTGYTYYPQHQKSRETISVFVMGDGNRDMSVPTLAEKISNLNANKTMITDRLHLLEKVPHKVGSRRGVNAVYGDGSVSFVDNREAFNEDLWHPGSTVNGPGNDPDIFKAILANMDRSK
jgi:prepilin-type N-terminal cleavage/methylation domain-containing protein